MKKLTTATRLLAALSISCLSPELVEAEAEPAPIYEVPAARSAPGSNPLHIATLNIAHGRGDALNQMLVSGKTIQANLATIARTLRQGDIHVVALQEADTPSLWSGRFDHSATVAKLGGFGWYANSPHANLGIGHYGTAVLSTLVIRAASSHDFPPSLPTARKGFTLVELDWPGTEDAGTKYAGRVDVISIHMDFSRKSVRQTQLTELRKALEGRTNPVIIMGDFNSESIARQLMTEEGENGRHLHTPGDTSPPWHSYKDKRLDWILVSSELEFVDYQTDPAILSDHRLVTARVRLATTATDKEKD